MQARKCLLFTALLLVITARFTFAGELPTAKPKDVGLDADKIQQARDAVKALIVTKGEHGSTVIEGQARTDIAAIPPRRIVDPTGVGDAFRGGLMKGIAAGLPYAAAARIVKG